MHSATVADLRNHFRRVSAWIENGESVEIIKHGKAFALLVPAAQSKAVVPASVDFAARRKAIWGERVFSAAEAELMRTEELEGEQG